MLNQKMDHDDISSQTRTGVVYGKGGPIGEDEEVVSGQAKAKATVVLNSAVCETELVIQRVRNLRYEIQQFCTNAKT